MTVIRACVMFFDMVIVSCIFCGNPCRSKAIELPEIYHPTEAVGKPAVTSTTRMT